MNTPHTQDFEKKVREILENGAPTYDAGTKHIAFTYDGIVAQIAAAHTEALQAARIDEITNLKDYLLGDLFDEKNIISDEKHQIVKDIVKRIKELES